MAKQGNWFKRHKVITAIIAVLVVLGILGNVTGGTNSSSRPASRSNTKAISSTKKYRFADRADKQPKDVELLPKESGTVEGVKLTVTSVQYATSLGEFDTADSGKTYVVADVDLVNTSDSTKPYNELDFRMQTAGGQVLDTTFVSSISDLLNSGDLVTGGSVNGKVVFQVPLEPGHHQYLIWKPSVVNADRAIVRTQ